MAAWVTALEGDCAHFSQYVDTEGANFLEYDLNTALTYVLHGQRIEYDDAEKVHRLSARIQALD